MTAATLVSSSTPQTNATNSLAVNMPAGIVAGNLLVVELAHGGAGMNNTTGWTRKWFALDTTAVFYRWADGTETSTYTFSTGTASAITQAVAKQYAGSIGSGDPFDVFATGSNVATANSPTLTPGNTTVADTYQVFTDFKNASRTLTGNPSGFTLRQGVTLGQCHSFDKNQAVAGSPGSLTATFSGGGSTHSTLFYAIKPLQTAAPTGIASTAAFGTARLDLGLAVAGIASTLAFGTAALGLSLSPSGIASTAAFGTPSVAVGVAPSGIASTAALGTPSLTPTVAPAGIASTSALGTPGLTLGLAPSGIAPTSALGSPTIAEIPPDTIVPPSIAPILAFGTPLLTEQLTVTGIASTLVFGTAELVDTQTVAPSGIASEAAFGTAALALELRPTGIASTLAFGIPSVLPDQDVAPSAIASTLVFGTPSLVETPVPAKRDHVVTVRESSRTYTIAEASRKVTVEEAGRTITIREG